MNRSTLLLAILISWLLPPAAAEEAAGREAAAATARIPLPDGYPRLPDGLFAVIHTAKGEIILKLFFKETPLACANFAGLAEGKLNSGKPPGTPFYNGLTFHRAVPDFIIQSGCPEGNGRGGPGYTFQDEFTPNLKHNRPGTLAMANNGPNANGSQFYITLTEQNRLNYMHTVFGRVVEGMHTVKKIIKGDVIREVKILRRGAKARAFPCDQNHFNRLKTKVKKIPPDDLAFLHVADNRNKPLMEWENRKLYHYEQTTGRRAAVRVFPSFPAQARGGRVDSFAKDLAAQLDADQGVLITYYEMEDLWNVQIGEDIQPVFSGRVLELLQPVKKLSFSKKTAAAISTAITAFTEAIDAGALAPQKTQ